MYADDVMPHPQVWPNYIDNPRPTDVDGNDYPAWVWESANPDYERFLWDNDYVGKGR
jgi:hypothetical protein